jgi:hypothetical protein
MVRFFGRIAFFAFGTSVFAGEMLTALVTAAQGFFVATQEQLAAGQKDITATELVEKTVFYAEGKTNYFNALRAEASGTVGLGQVSHGVLDCRWKTGKTADEETSILLERFSDNPGVNKAKAEFERAQ